MDKSVSIVKVDHRPYRVIAQENWGLTDEQMKGKHVHHRIHRSKGGTNDPCNLYVCSPWYHDVVWHNGSGGFIELAAKGGRKGAEAAHAIRTPEQKLEYGRKAAAVTNAEKDEEGKSVNAVKRGKASAASVTPEKKTERGRKGAASLNASLTPEQKSENGRKGGNAYAASTSLERRREIAKEGATAQHAQRWQSTIDGFIGNAGNVAQHNARNGWDPGARVRVYPPKNGV
jgi:hypothetical protein